MTKLEQLQYELYMIGRYDIDTRNYLRLNQLLWSNIQGLDEAAIVRSIEKLKECNRDN